MTDREEKIYARSFEYQQKSTPLKDIIDQEPDMKEWKLEYLTVAEANPACYAVVPYEDYMVMAHDRFDPNGGHRLAEIAIYRQHDLDDHPLMDSLNYNATYRFLMVCDETYRNMTVAIANAPGWILRLEDEFRNIVADMTDGDPLADLTEADAERLITQAQEIGYEYADILYPTLFLEIYDALKGDRS